MCRHRAAAGAVAFVTLAICGHATPAGNGYQSQKVRLPHWPPVYDMGQSTLLMPCNYSGWHRVDEALRYGLVSYDWANAQALWSRGAPVNDEELLTAQADKLVAADPSGRTRVGVYRNAIKAFNWFGSIIQEKLDDPQYSGWFIQFKDCTGPGSNVSYVPPACTLEKCSCAWHDHAGQLGGSAQDCGKSPCGGYVFDHRNASFSEWFLHAFVISSHTILRNGISELYLDDRVELWGIAEAEGRFLQDTGLTQPEMQDLKIAFEQNMETLYDEIIERGAFAWQMLYDGPDVLPPYLYNGNLDPSREPIEPAACAAILRSFCRADGIGMQRALAYTHNVNPDNAIVRGDQYLAVFLLTRGAYAWIGYDYRGCKSDLYPRPEAWDFDYGQPMSVCFETAEDSMIFKRSWSKAQVEWDCNLRRGAIAALEAAEEVV